jgi:hypothetical protein
MYLVYIPRMRVQANVYYHGPPPAHPFFQVFTMSNSANAYRSTNWARKNRHFTEPPNWDRRPLLGGDGGLYDHTPIKSNAFST